MTILEVAGNFGDSATLTIGVDGLPLVSYYTNITGNLRVAHCGSLMCVLYQYNR